jgi:hypothetical protein
MHRQAFWKTHTVIVVLITLQNQSAPSQMTNTHTTLFFRDAATHTDTHASDIFQDNQVLLYTWAVVHAHAYTLSFCNSKNTQAGTFEHTHSSRSLHTHKHTHTSFAMLKCTGRPVWTHTHTAHSLHTHTSLAMLQSIRQACLNTLEPGTQRTFAVHTVCLRTHIHKICPRPPFLVMLKC